MVKDYLPEVHKAYKNVNVPIGEKVKVLYMATGFGIKILYAFLYQERDLLPPWLHKIFYHPIMIRIGGHLIPFVNDLADSLTGFEQTDFNLNNSMYVYPGQQFCKYD